MNYTSILLATLSILSTTSLSLKINHDKKLFKIPRSDGYSLEKVSKALVSVTGDENFDSLYFNDMTRGDVKALSRDLIEALPTDRLKFLLAKLSTFDLPVKSESVVRKIIEAVQNRLKEIDLPTAYNMLRETLPPAPRKMVEEGEDVMVALSDFRTKLEDVVDVLYGGEGILMEEMRDVKDQGDVLVEEMGEFVEATGNAAKKRFHRNPLNYFRDKPTKSSKSVTISEEEDEVESTVKGYGEDGDDDSKNGSTLEKKKKRSLLSSLFGRKEKSGFAPSWISNFRGDPQELLSNIVESFAALSTLTATDPASMAAYRPMLITIAQLITKAATAEGSLLELEDQEMEKIAELERSLARVNGAEYDAMSGGFGGLGNLHYQVDPRRNQFVPSSSKKIKSTKHKL